ncbi:hypothetical protein [Clostridium tertium]|uniref:hypothetical protein n=1 Tax=Clostridium tertium TaxID=1559 RepID=UPI00288A70A2|nr:hypothetical protein [Clostridium tertium]
MPYLAYNSRIKQIKRNGRCKSEAINNKITWKLYAFVGVMFLVLGILNLIEKKYSSLLYIILGAFDIVLSLDYYKKYKKSL